MGETSTPVLLLGMEHYSALGVMRSLGRCGVRVYGVHSDTRAPAATSRYCEGLFVCDLEREPSQTSVEFLFAIARRLTGRPVLLATNDQSALFLAENCSRLEQVFRVSTNSLALVRALHDKREMHSLAKALGIPTIRTLFPQSRDDVIECARVIQFPVMLKAIDNIPVYRRAGKTTVIIHSREELIARYDAMEDPTKPTLMLQEYVPVRAESNWTFNGYFDQNSDCLFAITGHKIRQAPPYTGVISLGVCRPNPTVRDLTLKLVKGVGYKGIIDVGFLYDARDGAYKLHDVNPRLGASFRLFVGTGGLDVTRAAYLDLTGQSVPPSGICDGRKWAVEDADLISSCRYVRDGAQTIRQWIASYDGLREGAWFAGDDPRPFLDMCGRFYARMFRTVESKIRRRPVLPSASLSEPDRAGAEAAP
jgi:D-aspartate ligase